MDRNLLRYLGAEALGTFILVFAGTGAAVINDTYGGAVTHVGIAITFGLVVLAMIYAIGDISGAHINPAVTIAFAVGKRFEWEKVVPFVVAQCLGGISASLLLRVMYPVHEKLGGTIPSGTAAESFILELILTFILMFVVLCVSTGAKEKGITAGIAVGSVVGFEAMFAGPACGASMNPARSLGPAVASGQLDHLWIYLIATTLGAVLAVPVFALLKNPEETETELES